MSIRIISSGQALGMVQGFQAEQVLSITELNHEITKAISDSVDLPVVAAGGAGELEHFHDAGVKGDADILLAASVFHYRTFSIRQVKAYLRQKGLNEVVPFINT